MDTTEKILQTMSSWHWGELIVECARQGLGGHPGLPHTFFLFLFWRVPFTKFHNQRYLEDVGMCWHIIIHKILSRATTWWCSRRRDSLCGGSAARTSPTSPMVLISRVSDEAVVWQQLMMMNYDRCRRHPDRRLTRKQVSRGRVRQWRQPAGRVRVPSCQGNIHPHLTITLDRDPYTPNSRYIN